MSIKEKRLEKIALKASHYQLEAGSLKRLKRRIWLLYYECVRDDIAIRAESFSYFTLLSMLPIIAGLFLIVSLFSNWAPLQTELQGLFHSLLRPLPDSYRDELLAYILEFKDRYLQSVAKNGLLLGGSALLVLLSVVAKVFLNMEELMNTVWSVHENRPLLSRIRNLLLTAIIFPLVIFFSISTPGLIERFGGVEVGVFLGKGVPIILLVGGLFFLFHFFPNTQVKAKNAFYGALVGGGLLLVSSALLRVYFHFGTQTAYGKAAVIPLLAYFINISWMIVMVGAEWSFILQKED